DMSSVHSIADKVTMLHDGQVQWSGNIRELDNSGNPYLEQFINGHANGPIEAVR
ncbi:MAG: ABC transporter ATP-binding protein, partial [Rhodobacterales bacterium]